MSTSALTYIYDDSDNVICSYYKHFDGFPSDYGLELSCFLSKIKLINGIDNQKMFEYANGMDCLAAQLIVKFKKDVGDVYMVNPNSTDFVSDYSYNVYYNNIIIENSAGRLFDGNWADAVDFCKSSD